MNESIEDNKYMIEHDKILLKLLDDNILLDILKQGYSFVKKMEKNNIVIKRVYEYPLICNNKIEGYIDLLIILLEKRQDITIAYNFVCELKLPQDLLSPGNILRQIKRYKYYYDGPLEEFDLDKNINICLLGPETTEEIKKFFENENITYIELHDMFIRNFEMGHD